MPAPSQASQSMSRLLDGIGAQMVACAYYVNALEPTPSSTLSFKRGQDGFHIVGVHIKKS